MLKRRKVYFGMMIRCLLRISFSPPLSPTFLDILSDIHSYLQQSVISTSPFFSKNNSDSGFEIRVATFSILRPDFLLASSTFSSLLINVRKSFPSSSFFRISPCFRLAFHSNSYPSFLNQLSNIHYVLIFQLHNLTFLLVLP